MIDVIRVERRYRTMLVTLTLGVGTGCGGKIDATGVVGYDGVSGASNGVDAAGSSANAKGGRSSIVGGANAGGKQSGGIGNQSGTVNHSGGGITSPGNDLDEYKLESAPLLFGPSANAVGLNVVLAKGEPSKVRVHVRPEGQKNWGDALRPIVRATDVAQWQIDGLSSKSRYEYEVFVNQEKGVEVLYAGSVITQRKPGDSFTFALITDSHTGYDLSFSNQGDPDVTRQIANEVGTASPDFMLNLGDMLDFHQFGFNVPPPDSSYTRQAYLNYRTLLGDTLGRTPHFATIGNWEGEDGFSTAEEISRSRQPRLLYLPGPQPSTYPESGSKDEDYYAFTWGDALFVVLNVMSYTTTRHLLSSNPGLPDDWTLGAPQLNWLTETLSKSSSKWKFLAIHHTVGGAAGDDANSAYGRGGGQAAYVGEQAKIHELMKKYGVQIFFYGHDHVFADMSVDGIHYTLPGNAGAPWMFTSSETGYAQSWQKWGWGRVTVGPSNVNVQFVALGGSVIYEYTLQ
jgi:hypothetical protein